MSHAEASTHSGAAGDLLVRRHALHGVRIVSAIYGWLYGYYILFLGIYASSSVSTLKSLL